MTKKEFIDLLIEEIEIEDTNINETTELNAIEEWDSMAVMMVIGLADEHFDVKLKAADFKETKTIGDIIQKIGSSHFS